MTSPELGPALRLLAQAILEQLDPAVQAMSAIAGDTSRSPALCQQVWCPVCALLALADGEQHPLLNLLAEHGVTLMALIRSMAEHLPQEGPAATQPAATSRAADGDAPPSSNGRYHHIPIVVETPPGDVPDPSS